MRKITLLMCFVLCTVFGLRAQNVTLPYVQDFAALTSGDMNSSTGSSIAVGAGVLSGIASVSDAYQAGGAVCLGSSSNIGSFTTEPISVGGASFIKVSFTATAFVSATPLPARLVVTYGSKRDTIALPAAAHGWPLSATDMVRYNTVFVALPTPTAITVSTVAGSGIESRVFTDNFKVQSIGAHTLSEDFQGTIFPPKGWIKKRMKGTYEWVRAINEYSTTGNAFAKVRWDNYPGHDNWLITPRLTPLAGEKISFKVRTPDHSQGTTLYVRVSKSSTDTADFTDRVLTLKRNTEITSGRWTKHTVDLQPYVGKNIYVAFQVVDRGGMIVSLDDVEGPTVIDESCPLPSSLISNNVTVNSADLSWTETGSASSWIVEYSTSSTFVGAVPQTVMGTPSLSLSGLTDNTVYYVRIKADCLGGEYSEWITSTFKTKCYPLTGTINIFEEFESVDAGSIPECWSKITGDATFPSVINNDIVNKVRSKAIRFGGSERQYLVMQQFGVPLNTLELSFKLCREDINSGIFQVGYMTDPTDSSTFVPVASYDDGDGTSYKKMLLKRILFTGLADSGSNRYIAFRYGRIKDEFFSKNSYYWLDSVSVTEAPYCVPPYNVKNTFVSADSAVIVYKSPNGALSTKYVYGEATIDDPYTLIPRAATGDTIKLSGLDNNKKYKLWLKSECSGGRYSEWSLEPLIFTTLCADIDSLNENFESIDVTTPHIIPDCWYRLSPKSTIYPSVINGLSQNGVRDKAIKFADKYPQYLILPRFGVPLNTLQLDFRLDRQIESSGIMQVGYMTDPTDSSTFVPVASFNDKIYKRMLPKRVFFTNVVDDSTNRYIAFRYGKVGDEDFSTSSFYFLDSVLVKAAPTCVPPTNISVTYVSSDSAVIGYKKPLGATSIRYAYTTTSYNAPDIDPTTLTPHTTTSDTIKLSELNSRTEYSIWIQTNCGGGAYSEWMPDPVTFVTLCGDITAIEEDFEAVSKDSIPECWKKISTNGSYPSVLEADPVRGTNSKSIRFSNSYPQYLILPRSKVALNTLQLDFSLNRIAIKSGTFQVGYMTDPTDGSTFVAVESFNDKIYKRMLPKRVFFTDVVDDGTNRYIAFRYGKVGTEEFSSDSYYWLDNISVKAAPTCLTPTELKINRVSADSAVITYKQRPSAIGYQYVYGESTETDPSNLTPISTGDTVKISGLIPNTDYKLWMRSDCGSGVYSEWSFEPLVFTTICREITSMNEDFESVPKGNIPDCWKKISRNVTYPSVVNKDTVKGLFSKTMKFMSSTPQYLVMSKAKKPLNKFQLRFNINKESKDCGILQVGYMTDPTDDNTFVAVASFNDNIYKMLLPKTVYFNNVVDNGNNRYIAFRYGKVGTVLQKTEYAYWIDDIVLEPVATCLAPTSLKAVAARDSVRVTFEHEPSATSWQYVLAKNVPLSATPPDSIAPIAISSDNIVIKNIESDKDYTLWVRTTSCTNDTSSWTLAIFRTKHCQATPISTSGKGIVNVKYGNYNLVDNTTENEPNNYGDYSSISGDVGRGDSARVEITYITGTTQYKTRIYVDWNRDYDFDDPGEQVYSGISKSAIPSVLKASFLVPGTVENGNYRMRIVGVSEYYTPNPCYSAYGGTVEDYTLTVTDPITCIAVGNINAKNIATSSADITWTASGSETSWDIVVSATPLSTAQLNTSSAIVNVTSPSYNAISLQANTSYYTYIRGVCSATDKSPWRSIVFKTKPLPVLLPYIQDFSGSTSEVFTWSDTPNTNRWTVGNAIGNGGKSMYISKDGVAAEYSDGESHSLAYIIADFDNSVKFGISFDWIGKGEASYDFMRVYMVPDSLSLPVKWNREAQDWISAPGVLRLGNKFFGQTTWNTFSDTLPSEYAGTKRKLVFMWINDNSGAGSPTMAVDNIYLIGYNCNTPSDFTVSKITGDSAQIKWRKGDQETSWIVEYKKPIDSVWISDTVNDTVYNISNLEPTTTYKVRIKAVCTNNKYSGFLLGSFTTRCADKTIGNGQLIYDFEQYGLTLPECWTRTQQYDNNGTIFPIVKNYPKVLDNQALFFSGNSTQIVATEKYVENANTIELEFDVWRDAAATSGKLEIGVLSDPYDPSTFVFVKDVTPLISADRITLPIKVALSDAPNGKYYIGFRQKIENANEKTMYGIDNLDIHKIPNCNRVDNTLVNVTSNDPSATSAEVSWIPGGGESSWELQYKEPDSTQWRSIIVSGGNSMSTLRRLKPQTKYELRIRSICSQTDTSLWTRRNVFFTTPCVADTLPFTENFENGWSHASFPKGCWSKYDQLASDVFDGSKLTNVSQYSGWKYFEDTLGLKTGGKVKVEIWGTMLHSWLVTPSIMLPSGGSAIDFDASFTIYNSGGPATGTRADDKFMVIVSTDNGNTWQRTNATVWSNDGTGQYVLNDITNGLNQIHIDLSRYSGLVKIAFYAESTVDLNGINYFNIDNIRISATHDTPPTVVTLPADNIGDNTATLHRRITEGTYPISDDGFYYKAVSNTLWTPTDSVVTGLSPQTTYEYYAFAKVNDSVYRGAILTFTTTGDPVVHPTVTTEAATDITQTGATLHKTITSDPSEPVTEQGWKWRKATDSTWLVVLGNGKLTALEQNTKYEFYAYAKTDLNADGYNGSTLTFTTLAHTPPTVTTLDATAIGMYAATLRKTVTAGTEPIVEQGWKYKKVGEVVWTQTTDGNLNGLGQNTEYEFYAYAVTNTYPMTKGETLRFTTISASDVDRADYRVVVYPNPADDFVTIALDGSTDGADVQIADMLGRVVGRYRISAGESSISFDVSSLAAGNYLVRIVSGDRVVIEKLIIEQK